METTTINFTICYNVTPNSILSTPLPNAYLVASQDGTLGYIEKLALPHVLDSYKISYKGTGHEQLLEICQLLKPDVLAQKFQPKRRKASTLTDIMADPKSKPVVMQYVNRKLTTFYQILQKEHYPLCYDAQRREPILNSLLTREQEPLKPLISFQKTAEGIHYKFQLGIGEEILTPCKHTIINLHDQPAQLVIDRKWYTLEHVNAKKLNPFLTKETVFIPAKNTKLYFEKFISAILKKVEIEAEGFSIETSSVISSYSLELYYDFFLQKVACHILFNYQGVVFSSYETRKIATDINYETQDITLVQTKRALEAELEISQKLLQLGLTEESGKFFLEGTTTEDSYALVGWLAKNETTLKKEHFSIVPIELESKKK